MFHLMASLNRRLNSFTRDALNSIEALRPIRHNEPDSTGGARLVPIKRVYAWALQNVLAEPAYTPMGSSSPQQKSPATIMYIHHFKRIFQFANHIKQESARSPNSRTIIQITYSQTSHTHKHTLSYTQNYRERKEGERIYRSHLHLRK